jgi:hypothetical protein
MPPAGEKVGKPGKVTFDPDEILKQIWTIFMVLLNLPLQSSGTNEKLTEFIGVSRLLFT